MRIALFAILLAGLLTATQWEPETRLTDNDYPDFFYWSTQRRVVVDREGRVHVAWHVMNSGLGTYRFQIYYARWHPESGWTADTMLSADLYETGVYCKYPSLAVDSAGVVHAVWAGGASDGADSVIYHKSCVPTRAGNGGWEESSRLLSGAGPRPVKNCPTVTATPDHRVHVSWLEGTGVICRERRDTTWLAPVVVEGGSNYKAYPAVAGGPDNRLHLTWYGREGSSGYYNVFYKARVDTSWGATENVSQGVRHQMYQSIAVDPVTGAPHVLWQCYGAGDNRRRIVHRWRAAAGWQPTDTISEPADTLNQETGQLIFSADGRGHAVWAGRSAAWPTLTQVRYAERTAAGVWLAPFNVTDTGGSRERPSIAAGPADAPGEVHAVWCDYRHSNAEVYYSRGSASQFLSGERPAPRYRAGFATVVRGSLRLGAGLGHNPDSPGGIGLCPALLLDITGRKVMDLQPGENDVRRLAPGVYFLRPVQGGERSAPERVVITR